MQSEIEHATFLRMVQGDRLPTEDHFESVSFCERRVIGFSIVTIGDLASLRTQKL
jgi:hypothetical protein